MKMKKWILHLSDRFFGKHQKHSEEPVGMIFELQEPVLTDQKKDHRFYGSLAACAALLLVITGAAYVEIKMQSRPVPTPTHVASAVSAITYNAVEQAGKPYINDGNEKKIITKGTVPIPPNADHSLINGNKQVQKINDFDSPYTLCCKNSDGTYTAYIFSSPVSYQVADGQYQYIDSSIIKNPDADMLKKGYQYRNKDNNIKTYFPQSSSNNIVIKNNDTTLSYSQNTKDASISNAKLEKSENMYGDIMQSVVYGSSVDPVQLKNFMTKTGVDSEVVLNRYPGTNQFQYRVTIPGYATQNDQSGYIRFTRGSNTGAVISCGMAKDSCVKNKSGLGDHISLDNDIALKCCNMPDTYIVTITLNNDFLKNKSTRYPVKFDALFDLYTNKLADNTVYSETPAINAYFSPFSVIGNSEAYGDGEAFIRFRFNYFYKIKPDSIISSSYHIRELSGNQSALRLTLNQINSQWWCYQLNWDNRNTVSEKYSEANGNFGFKDVALDITKYTRDCYNDTSWMKESYGLALKADSQNKFLIFGSSDNTEYAPYVVMHLKEKPQALHFNENINPGY